MDGADLIRQRAARLWNDEYEPGDPRLAAPGCGEDRTAVLRTVLEEVAERVCGLSVFEDPTLAGTNIEGELNRDDGYIAIRPGLPRHRANFVIAHEIAHWALDHPLQAFDTPREIRETVTPDDLSVERQQKISGLDLSDAALTALRGYNERDLYEMQANAFAAELLVPADRLRGLLQADPRRTVPSLAAQFGVESSLLRLGMTHALRPAAPAASAPSASPRSLDPDQANAAGCPAPALVLAGPGAGKTRILVARYARLVEQGAQPRQILALTFANKAAGEMRERLAAIVPPEHAASVEVFTFHAFGLQLLQQYGERIGLKLPLRLVTLMDAVLLFRRRAAEKGYGFLSDVNQLQASLRQQLWAIARSKEENAGPERWQELADTWSAEHPGEPLPDWAKDGVAFFRDYQTMLRRHGLVDYGDLQTEAVRLFSVPEVAAEIRERYQHILVDEFQDINYVSGRLVRELDGGRGVVWVVGDPRQSIYGFRGASPVNLSRFRTADYYPGSQVYPLTRNYRSVPDIVAAGAALPVPVAGADAALTPPALVADRQASADRRPAVAFVQPTDEDTELRYLASRILAERDSGRPLSDIAVLARTNKQAAHVAAALTAQNIPHRWGGPIHERETFRLLISALKLAADSPLGIVGLTMLSPGADIAPDFTLAEADLRRLFADGRGRWRARRLLTAAASGAIPDLTAAGRTACAALLVIAENLSASARPHHNLCLYLFEHARWLRTLLPEVAQADHRIRGILATVTQVLDLASRFASEREALARSVREQSDRPDQPDGIEPSADSAGPDGDDWDTGTSTEAFLEYLDAALDDDGDLDVPFELEIGGDAVSILTAHRSKGLEWPVVFIPYCADGQFPSAQQHGKASPIPPDLIHTDGESADQTHTREEACLFYVAVTRAKDRLYLSHASRYPGRIGRPSALLHALLTALRAEGRLATPTIDPGALPAAPPPPAANPSDTPTAPYDIPDALSESALRSYGECPRQYLFARVYGLPQPHRAYVQAHRALYTAARDSADPAAFQADFERNWTEQGPSPKDWQAPILRRTFGRTADDLGQRITAPDASAAQPASRFNQPSRLRLGPLPDGTTQPIRFTVDEDLTSSDGTRTLRRHKQSARLPKSASADPKDILYALYADQEAADHNTPAPTLQLYYPQLASDQPITLTDDKKRKGRDNLIQLVTRLKAGDFAPNPGATCAKCPFTLICPR